MEAKVSAAIKNKRRLHRQVCALPETAVSLRVKPGSHALQSSWLFVSQRVPLLPSNVVGVPYGHEHEYPFAAEKQKNSLG